MIIKLFGLLGGICFGWAALPAAIKCIRAGKNIGVPVFMAWLIFSGTLLLYTYLYLTYMRGKGIDVLLTVNYSVEAFSWGSILLFNYFPASAKAALATSAE